MVNEAGFTLFPYQYLSSRVITTVATAASSTSSSKSTLPSPSLFGAIIIQFTRKVMRPKVVLPILLLIVLLFDLDDTFELDEDTPMHEDNEHYEP